MISDAWFRCSGPSRNTRFAALAAVAVVVLMGTVLLSTHKAEVTTTLPVTVVTRPTTSYANGVVGSVTSRLPNLFGGATEGSGFLHPCCP